MFQSTGIAASQADAFIKEISGKNLHDQSDSLYQEQRGHLVLVNGGPGCRMLTRVHCIALNAVTKPATAEGPVRCSTGYFRRLRIASPYSRVRRDGWRICVIDGLARPKNLRWPTHSPGRHPRNSSKLKSYLSKVSVSSTRPAAASLTSILRPKKGNIMAFTGALPTGKV